jgi:hypothetical protein
MKTESILIWTLDDYRSVSALSLSLKVISLSQLYDKPIPEVT